MTGGNVTDQGSSAVTFRGVTFPTHSNPITSVDPTANYWKWHRKFHLWNYMEWIYLYILCSSICNEIRQVSLMGLM